MYGVLDSVASGPVEARTSENSTMVSLVTYLLLRNITAVYFKIIMFLLCYMTQLC